MGNLRQRRAAIAIVFATLGLTSLFLAQGTTRLVAASVLDLHTADIAARRGGGAQAAERSGTPGRERKDPTAILRRNIFDHEQGDLTKIGEEETKTGSEPETEPGPEEPIDPDAPLPKCSGNMRLVGSVVFDREPRWSFAAMMSGGGKTELYRTGMTVDGNELIAVQLNRVVLQPEGEQVCQVQMFAPETPKSARSRKRQRRADKDEEKEDKEDDGGAVSSQALAQGIEKVSETEYNVDRRLVNKVLQNQAKLMRQARIIPHEKGGRVVGVKLYGVRRDSLLGKLGMHNGDMLRTINGFNMTSPDKALEAYSRLRNADHLTVAVQRRGQDMNIDYNIR